METVKEFFSASPALAWSIVSIMTAMVSMVALWDKLKWWWLNTWASFPMIGRIASLSKDLNRDTTDKAWFKAEKALCRDYKKFIRIQDEHDFNEKIEYLNKAGDNGRKPTPTWIWLLTVAMVFVEAMGFSYVLAGYTLPGASENMQQTGAYGIAFLISIILVALTHFAGHELHQSSHIKNARREWAEDGRTHKFTTGNLPLAKPQSADDGQPAYTQLANRVGTHESYKIAGLTVVFVIVVAVFATYVRGQVLEKTLHEEVVGKSTQMSIAITANSDGLNMAVKTPGNPALPDADVAQNQAAKDKAVMDEINIDRHGGWGTFIVLAFVFVFLQILGVIFGYRWGFAGQNSAAAYRAIGGGRYTTYADVREHYKEIADAAQAKLENLQQRLMARNAVAGTDGMHTTKTFYDFMELSRQEESRDRSSQRQHTAQNAALSQAAAAPPAPVAPPAAPVAKTPAPAALPTIDEVVRRLESLQDKDAKKSYIHSLPQPLQGDVLKAIKATKEAEKANVARSQLDAELDDLL
jgi:hypothetical protein